MERRDFLQSGFAAGLLGLGGTAVIPSVLSASPRVLADGSVRLSSNENPLGISPAARTAIVEGLDLANRYPGASKAPVVDALAAKHGVRPENILMGNGSTEVNQMFVQLFARVRLVTATPTYEDIGRYAAPFALPVTQVPLRADFSHDLDRMKEVVDRSDGTTVVYICNPNNPTATITRSAEIDSWISSAPDNVYFLMDEAYYEYAEADSSYWSALKFVPQNPNVIVVRTFSKIFGMAGMRLGYAVAHEDTIGRVGSIASYNNTNHFACVAALASLQDDSLVQHSVDVNAQARTILEDALDELDIERLPSHTNFLMHRIQGELQDYIGRMREKGWLVGRPFSPMLSYNRVSFSLPEHMAQFAETLREFRSHGYV